jgi:phosphatidate cytidylyltransferase
MLKVRILTSMVLIPSFLAALFLLPDIYWALLMLVFILIGIWEWSTMAGWSTGARYIYLAATAAFGLALAFGSDAQMGYIQQHGLFWGILAATLFWIVLAPLWLMSRYHVKNLFSMAFAGWLVILPTWLALVSLRRISPWLLLAIIATIWLADSAAYFAGKRFGKHKLAAQISPGKTWEGVLGAWIAVSVYGISLCLSLGLNPWLIVGLWGITVISIMGDLLESLLKRQAGLKDSGNLLPGHGGLLDRIDGLTSALPLAAFFIYFPLYYAMLWHD